MTATNTAQNRGEPVPFSLRRVYGPYAIWPIVIVLLAVVWWPYVANSHNWSPVLEISAVLGPLIVLIIYAMSRYRISYRNGTIVTRSGGFGGEIRIIRIDDITRLKQEASDVHTLLKLARPSHRITIYANTPDGETFTDVSLKHFNREDVRRLIKIIHDRRPEIGMPKGWS